MKKSLLIFPVLISILLIGCGVKTTDTLNVKNVADQAIQAIKTKDFAMLATLASSDGVRFSAYEYVDPTTDIILNAQEIANAPISSVSYMRGSYDGTGDPIYLGIIQYRNKFVYDVDFQNAPEVYRNQKFERGNIINNIFDVYVGKEIVEYHFNAFDPQYGGMDWRSLFLIFDQENGSRKLIGIVHGQRTI